MQASLTKQQLRELQAHRGCVDMATGKRFIRFCGGLDVSTGLYVGELELADVVDATDATTFSLDSVIGSQSPEVMPFAPAESVVDTDPDDSDESEDDAEDGENQAGGTSRRRRGRKR